MSQSRNRAIREHGSMDVDAENFGSPVALTRLKTTIP